MSPEEVLRLRSALGLSQTTFGNRFDVSQATVSLWEHGHHPVGPDYVDQLYRAAESAGIDLSADSSAFGADETLLFGEWLQLERTARGLTRTELADRSGVSYQQIRNLEIGESDNPQERTRHALEEALGTSTPDAVEEATEQDAEIEDVGKFLSFDPFDEENYPDEPGVSLSVNVR